MKKRTRNLLIAAVSGVACLAFYVYTVANKDGIVIRQHYSGWRTMNTISTVILVLYGALLALSLAIYGYNKWRRNKQTRSEQEQERQREAELSESKKLRTPEDVRQYFIKICDMRPNCQIAKKIVNQLDEMNRRQDGFEELLEVNDFKMAGESIREVLQDAEDSICDDCRIAINAYIIDDEAGFESEATAVYERNAYVLREVRVFLERLKAYAAGQISRDDAIQNLKTFGEAISAATNREVN